MQQQDPRLKVMMQGGGGGGAELQQKQPQPQKCPRCESLNTKFCYYNNYCLSQPRYFCKTCRRYWTQGGTLRNVPVGGGCRKGKRTKTSSAAAGETSGASQPLPLRPPQQPQSNLTTPQNILSYNPVIITKEPAAGNLAAPCYPTGGFLSSLAAIQPQSFNHHNIGGSSNLGLLQGFTSTVPSYGQIYHMGNKEYSGNPMYHNPSEESLIQSRSSGSAYQGFTDNSNNPNAPDTALWSISSTSSGNANSISNNNNNNGSVSGSLNPNQWHDLPGYDSRL